MLVLDLEGGVLNHGVVIKGQFKEIIDIYKSNVMLPIIRIISPENVLIKVLTMLDGL